MPDPELHLARAAATRGSANDPVDARRPTEAISATLQPPASVLLQSLPSHEARTVSMACLLSDIPCSRVALESLSHHKEALQEGCAVPVGSVEFVRAAMALARVHEPDNLSYHPSVATPELLRRRIWKSTLAQALASPGPVFVKPVSTKAFTGQFVGAGVTAPFEPGALANQAEMLRLDRSTPVWISNPLTLAAEWRLYLEWMQDRACYDERGRARYDEEGPDHAPSLDEVVVRDAISALACGWSASAPAALALDLAVTAEGHTVLVEVTDFWAVGLYGRALDAKDYLRMLMARWRQLHRDSALSQRATNTKEQSS